MFKLSEKERKESERIRKREEDALAKLRADVQEARAKASKKIVIEEDAPERFIIIKNLIEMKQGNLVDDKMLTGLNRADLLKYIKKEIKDSKLIPAILNQSPPTPAPVPTPPIDALPAEKAKQKRGPKPKVQKDPDAPKPPRKKRETKYVPEEKKRVTDFQVINPIWKHLVMLKIAKTKDDADAIDTLQGTIDAYKISQPYKHINPASIKKIFDAKKVDMPIPDWLQNYAYVPPQAKKPRGRPPKSKPEPVAPVVDQTMKTDLSNAQLKSKLLQKSKDKLKLENDKLKLENDEKDARLLEAQRFINELENTIRDYETELDKCRKKNGPYVSKKLERPAILLAGMDESAYESPAPIVVPTRTPKKTKKKAQPPQQFKLTNVMTEQQYIDKQIAKNESGMMGAEDINVLKFPEPAVKKPNITKIQSTDLLNLLNELETKGKKYEKTGIHFKANDLLGMIMYTYLIEKYNSDCFIYGYNDTIGYQPLLIDISNFGLLGDETQVLKYQKYMYHMIMLILDCIKKIQTTSQEVIIIPLIVNVMENSHINMLIYRKSLNVIDHYEPFGNQIPNVVDLNSRVNRILNLIVNKMNQINAENKYSYVSSDIQYLEPSNICPANKGFQTIENELVLSNKIEKGGFCMIWAIFFAQMTLENPSLTSKEIFDSISNNLNNDSLRVKSLIRGYLSYLYDTILNIVQQISGKTTITYKQIEPLLSTKKFQKLFDNFIQDKFQKYNKTDIKKYFEKSEPEYIFSEFNISNIQTTESEMMGAEDINVAKEESSKLFSFFHNLQVKGREYETTGIQYMSNGLMIAILTYYLNNKYGLSCRVRRVPTTFNLKGSNEKEIKKFKTHLRECIRQLRPDQNIMFIPIGMKIDTQGSHTNMLIFRKDGFVVEHYDPNGSDSPRFKKLVNILRPVFDDMRINYEPSKIPVGFQKIESIMNRTLGPDIIAREGSVGFCTMWSFLVAEMALANPAMSTDDILQYLLSKITKTNQNLFLRNIIRGYTHYIYESLSAFLKEKSNIDLDLTQEIEESKMRDIILELEKVYNEPKTQAKETIPVPAPVAPPKPPPAKYQNIIEEWDMATLPHILYQEEPKIYDAIEKKVNSLEKKGDGVVIADLLFFIKPFVNELFAHYGSNMNALTIIQDGIEDLIKYINSDVVRHRDDTPYLGKFFNQKNKMIIYNLLKK